MARKKFAIRSFFTTRPAKSGLEEEHTEYASDSDDLNDAHPFDPNEVNRPPKLDDRTETELRKACARIVENLKPSGHDLEDTRMQSDILVDNPDANLNLNPAGFPAKPPSTKPQPNATWYLEESTRSSQYVNPRNVVKSPDKRGSTYRISGIAADSSIRSDGAFRNIASSEHLTARPIENTESPKAPLATVGAPSRNLASPLAPQPRVDYDNRSSNSISNSRLSDNPALSSPSAQTSIDPTPSSTSKRTSDNPRADASSANASAGAGPWMKQEVDKRISAEKQARTLPPTRDSNLSSEDPTYGEAQAVPIKHRSVNLVTSGQPKSRITSTSSDQTSGRLSAPFEQPQYAPSASPLPNGVAKSPGPAPTEKLPNPLVRQDSTQLAADYQKSIMPTSKPSVAAEEDESLTSARAKSSNANSRRVSNTVHRTTSSSSQRSDGSNRLSRGIAPVSPVSPNFPKTSPTSAPPKPIQAEQGIPQIPPLPDKHQYDESILVKDFYQPSITQKLKPNLRPANAQQPGDVEAADFDSIMSVVKPGNAANKGAPNNGVAAAQQPNGKLPESAPRATTSRPTSSAAETTSLQKRRETPTIIPVSQVNATTNGDGKEYTRSRPESQSQRLSTPDSNPRPLSYHPIAEPPPPPKDASRQDQGPVLSPPIASPRHAQGASPAVVSSSRTSISATVPASPYPRSSTSKRGFRRLLSKLGNSDRPSAYVNGYVPSRRKFIDGYAPGAYVPGYGVNGGIEENDEWFDEQACAAPVVGFGRGW